MRRHIGSPPVTYGLIITNVVVFLLELTAPDLDAFIFQYALVPARISFSNFFSFMPFVTSQFLHGGSRASSEVFVFLFFFVSRVASCNFLWCPDILLWSI